MLAPEEVDVIGILELECHQQADSFKRVEALVDIVAQENILESFHLSLIGVVEVFEESEELGVAAVEAAENFDGGSDTN